MAFLAYLLLLGVLLGLGTLAASVIPARGARLGLGAAVALALVVDSTWLIAPLTGWSPPLGDAAWLGALALVGMGALLVARHFTRHADSPPWQWPSRRDLVVLLVVVALFGAVTWVLPVPLDTDAQGFGYLALTLRDGQDYPTLAPWHPEVEYLYSPGFLGLAAHLAARFDLGLHLLQMVIGAAAAALFAWTAYDFGCELEDRRVGRAFLLASLIGTGLITAFLDSHYTALLALLCALAFLTFVLRFLQTWRWSDALLAAICLAAVPLSQPDMTLALALGYVPWLLTVWLSKPRPSLAAWAVIALVIPLVALGIAAPWLISLRDLLGSDIESPFAVSLDHWRTLVFMHGGVIVLLTLLGVRAGWRARSPAYVLMLTWLAAIVEFSTLGLLERALPDLVTPLLKYDYPFSLAWHGPIIPYTVLGGVGLLWLVDQAGAWRVNHWAARLAYPLAALALVALAAGVIFFDALLDFSKQRGLSFYGAFSSSADVAAMEWLRDNTPPGARVLNHPGPYEADWAPVIAERDTVYFRPQPFFRHTAQIVAEQAALRAFWRDPADPAHAALLADAGVRYVLVPQVFGSPARFASMLRWRPPIDEAASYLEKPVSRAPYLRLVFERDGAQVYEVVPTP